MNKTNSDADPLPIDFQQGIILQHIRGLNKTTHPCPASKFFPRL
jgi:hypothetical protein